MTEMLVTNAVEGVEPVAAGPAGVLTSGVMTGAIVGTPAEALAAGGAFTTGTMAAPCETPAAGGNETDAVVTDMGEAVDSVVVGVDLLTGGTMTGMTMDELLGALVAAPCASAGLLNNTSAVAKFVW